MSATRIYQEAIKALASAAIAQGSLASADGRAFLDNPLCGDCVEMQVCVADGAISALAHQVKGCLLCRASASLIGKHATGARLEDIEGISAAASALLEKQAPPPPGWEELTVFAPVHAHPSRYGCVLLPFQALIAALRAAAE